MQRNEREDSLMSVAAYSIASDLFAKFTGLAISRGHKEQLLRESYRFAMKALARAGNVSGVPNDRCQEWVEGK